MDRRNIRDPFMRYRLICALLSFGFFLHSNAFGQTPELKIRKVTDYLCTLCDESAWPLGELNRSRTFFTEKAFPRMKMYG
jgi:hypothetical protein